MKEKYGVYFVGLFFLWLYAQIMEYLLIELWFWKSSINQNRLKWQYSWKQLLLYWGKAQSSKPRPERRCEAGWSGRRVRRQVEARRTNAQNAPEPGHCFLVLVILLLCLCLWNRQKKCGILNDQFDPLQVCAPLSHSSAWLKGLVRARDCLFGTSDDLLDDWVITYELSIYSSHLMTPS